MTVRRASRLVLASASPQRREILTRLGVPFVAVAANVSERTQGDPCEVARANARAKAVAIAAGDEVPELPVLGVDTVVALDGRLFGKPPDAAGARAALTALAGREHEVVSGVAIVGPDGSERSACATTRVTFRPLAEAEIDWYVGTGEWRERAGGYAIQGLGGALVAALAGDLLNVVGLPVALVRELAPGLLDQQQGVI